MSEFADKFKCPKCGQVRTIAVQPYVPLGYYCPDCDERPAHPGGILLNPAWNKHLPRLASLAKSYTPVAISLLGAVFVSSLDADYQLLGFTLWILSNASWLVYEIKKKEYPLAVQFGAFLLTSIIGAVGRLP